jgi:FkbM family methyltransferase
MEKTIHLTVSKQPSSIDKEVIARARDLHPTWEVKVWQDPVKKDGYFLEGYWEKTRSGAQFADLLRLDVLYRFGGVYIDGDLRLFRPLDELCEKYDFFLASEDGGRATQAIIGARRESPILRLLIDQLLKNEPDWSLPVNISTGPEFFSRHLQWRDDVTMLPRETFYPYNWYEVADRKVHRHSYGEHLWLGSWLPAEKRFKAQTKEGKVKLASSFARRWTKQQLKKCVRFGFGIWHRIKLADPVRPMPHIKFYQRSGELVVQTIHGPKLVIDGDDLSLTPELVLNGYLELAEEKFAKNIVKGGDWVIDVGANLGSFSLIAAQQVGPFGRVFAYEPDPRAMKLMTKSLVLNWMHERVIQRSALVGDNKETSEILFVADRLGDARLAGDDLVGTAFAQTLQILGPEQTVRMQLPCVRLDDEFSVDLPIKILKISGMGNESQALAGAERLLRQRCVDYVIVKVLQEIAGVRWKKILHQMTKTVEFGYSICTLTGEGMLVRQPDLSTAIANRPQSIVLAAREQYQAARSINA